MGQQGHPGFPADGKHFKAFFIVGGGNHGDLTETFGDAGIDVVGIAVPEIVLHMGIAFLEGRNPRGKEVGAAALDGGNVEHTLQAFLHFPDFLCRFIDQVENLVGVLKKQFALFGEGNTVGAAQKQFRIQLLFQILNLTA